MNLLREYGPAELYETVRTKWAVEDDEVLELMDSQAAALARRADSYEDAESCRLAMLSAAALERYDDVVVWRARAMARFVSLGWQEGAAAVVMTDMFRLLAEANDGYKTGRSFAVLRPSEPALAVLDELVRFSLGSGSGFPIGPNPTLIARFVHEKRGFLLLLLHRFVEAESCYLSALAHVGDEHRGQIKVPAGLALARYLHALNSGSDTDPFATETARIAADPETARYADLARVATTNAERMGACRRDVLPYELL